MSTDDGPASSLRRVADDRAALGVAAATLLALALRLFDLGARVAHYDEARVGYWILRYQENGIWEYHAIIHGPFLYHVDRVLFELFGASDFVARLPVAVVGGLLPLVAWLFRDRLRDSEMVALALLLAANPLMLYYSRFMRNDVLLVGFMLFAFAFYVRAYDTRKPRYLYAGTLAFALAFTTKENTLVYPVIWLGATALLLDHRLFLMRGREERDWLAGLEDHLERAARGVWRWRVHFLLSVVGFFAVVVFFYAPRAGPTDGIGLWKAFGNPGMFPAVVEDATVGSWNEFLGTWGGEREQSYLDYFESFVGVLRQGALVVTALSVLGYVADRYGGDGQRDVVAFTFYWGAVSVFGYPIIADNAFPWEMIHAVPLLAVPAAVGGALFYRWGRDALADDDTVSAGLTAVVVVVLVALVAWPAMNTVYLHPADRYVDSEAGTENRLVQYGQPAEGLRPTLETVEAVAAAHDGGTDVLYYGYGEPGDYTFYVANESDNDRWAAGGGWYNRLPLPWYTELADAEVDSTLDISAVESNPPPVVVARATNRTEVSDRLDGYRIYEHELTLYDSNTDIYVSEEYLARANESA